MVSERRIEVLHEGDGYRLEEDNNLFGTGYVKRSYVAWRDDFHVKTPPRKIATSLSLIPFPLGGAPWRLTCLDVTGKVTQTLLKPSLYCYLPPGTPFQLEVWGVGVLQLYAPIMAGIKGLEETHLAADFFESRMAPALVNLG